MGFTFLTLAIYQAAAAWWGESEGSNSPKPAPAQQGKRWFMVPPPFHIALFVSCLSPSLPAVVRLLSPLTALRKRPYVFCQATFILCSLPRGPFLPSIIHHYSLSCAFCSSSLFFSPLPLAIMCSLTITCDPFFSTYISSPASFLCHRTLGTMVPCTSPRWQPFTWETTAAMPMAMKTSIRHMCCRWMVSSGSFLTYSVGRSVYKML